MHCTAAFVEHEQHTPCLSCRHSSVSANRDMQVDFKPIEDDSVHDFCILHAIGAMGARFAPHTNHMS